MKLSVMAKPNAKECKVEKVSDDSFRVWVKEPPNQGEANTAVLKALAQYFGASLSQFKILSGHQSKKKTVGYNPSDKAN